MKKILLAIIALLSVSAFVVLAVFFVTHPNSPTSGNGKRNDESPRSVRLTIVASLFPQFDYARRIAGDKADVFLLLPPGVDSHSFEPTPSDVAKVYDADIFIYTGQYMEPWAQTIVESAKNDTLGVLDASSGIHLLREDDHEHESHGHHDHGYDPHFWLDPTLAIKMIENIEETISERDPQNADFYRENAKKCIEELEELDKDFMRAILDGKQTTLVFGGRFAYRYFMERYGLKYITTYRCCSAEAEPSVRDVTRAIDFIKSNDIPCVYHEELSDPRVARSIAEATGASLKLFRTGHNITKGELEQGVTFIDIMRENLENVRFGLD